MVHIRKKTKKDKMMGKWFWNLKGEEGNVGLPNCLMYFD